MNKIAILLLSVIGLTVGQASAQPGENPWTARVGVTISKLPGSGEAVESTPLIGFQAGITYNRALGRSLYLSPVLNFTQKGDIRNVTFTPNDETSERVTSAYWLELPVLVNYRFGLGSRTSLYVGLGPYVATGVAGNSTYRRPHTQADTEKYSKNSFGTGTWNPDYNPSVQKDPLLSGGIWAKGYKRFDFGGMVNIGVNFNRLNIAVTAGYGFTNIAKPAGIEQRNFSTAVTLGWNF